MEQTARLIPMICLGFIVSCFATQNQSTPDSPQKNDVVELAERKKASASKDFWGYWGDGRAEIATYEGKIDRYGALRDVRKILIYVTEPMNRQNWIKDDSATGDNRINVLKLNHLTEFQTGIYEYSVMKSIFSPVAKWKRRRFQPVKLNMTSQDWCGHLYHGLWIGRTKYREVLHSYFASEGDRERRRSIEEGTVFQDALWTQLRELDGKFNGGKDWSGQLIPRLWDSRTNHEPLESVSAEIVRKEYTFDGRDVTRFILTYGDTKVIYDVAEDYPHRIVHWKHSNGSEVRLKAHERLPYWKLNGPEGKRHRKKLGLDLNMLRDSADNADSEGEASGGNGAGD